MPVLDGVFSVLPAEQYITAFEPGMEIHQTLLEALEHAPDAGQLLDEPVDALGGIIHPPAEIDLLVRLAPLGGAARGDQLVTEHVLLPLPVLVQDVANDAADERQCAIGLL